MHPAYLLDGGMQETQLLPGGLLISHLGGGGMVQATPHESADNCMYGRAACH